VSTATRSAAAKRARAPAVGYRPGTPMRQAAHGQSSGRGCGPCGARSRSPLSPARGGPVGRRPRSHLIDVVGDLDRRLVALGSLCESLDASTRGGRVVFHSFGARAECERDLIRERTTAGLQEARARGSHGGRPTVWTPEKLSTASAMHESGAHGVVTPQHRDREAGFHLSPQPTWAPNRRAVSALRTYPSRIRC